MSGTRAGTNDPAAKRLLILAIAATLALTGVYVVGQRSGVTPLDEDAELGALVSADPLKPSVREIALTRPKSSGSAIQPTSLARTASPVDHLVARSEPLRVTGFATIGVTWSRQSYLADTDIFVTVRTRSNGAWSAWEPIEYDPEHGPDQRSSEGRGTRPGTDPIAIGRVSQVQVQATTVTGQAPLDLKLAIIDPQLPVAPRREGPAIDTAAPAMRATEPNPKASGASERASLAGLVTPKPKIYSRAQWGADESMRDKGSLHYGRISAGFVHHTVNANNYTADQVPAIIRGIYAYHTQSKGWSDIGYNFLVDRFGRIWEGRYGGVDRPVVGAHTRGYNDNAFAMSAIGNYETARPSAAMLDAYGRLFAWKLALHGVDASSTRQLVGTDWFQAINGHRDAGPTACPGRYLYDQLPRIRTLATNYQRPFTGRQRTTNLTGTKWPDLAMRDKNTKRLFVLTTEGQLRFKAAAVSSAAWAGMDTVTGLGDVTGDRFADVLARNKATGLSRVYPGLENGQYGPGVAATNRFRGLTRLAGVGDLNGDTRADVVARDASGDLRLFPGGPDQTFGPGRVILHSWAYGFTTGVGDFTGDNLNDVVASDSSGRLWVFPGNGRGGLGTRISVAGSWSGFNLISGVSDVTGDGKPDLFARTGTKNLSYVLAGNGRGGIKARYGPYTQFGPTPFVTTTGTVTNRRTRDLLGQDSTGRLVRYSNSGGRATGSLRDTGINLADTNLLLNVGDWNGDHRGDLMTRSTSTGTLYLRFGNGEGSFEPPIAALRSMASVSALSAVGDVTGDGFPDLIGRTGTQIMRIYPGNGAKGFRSSFPAGLNVAGPLQVGVGLLSSDGAPDSLFKDSAGRLVLARGNGPSGFTRTSVLPTDLSVYDWIVGVGDLDGNGRIDVLVRTKDDGQLWVFPGMLTGLGQRMFLARGFGRFDLVS